MESSGKYAIGEQWARRYIWTGCHADVDIFVVLAESSRKLVAQSHSAL